MEDMSSQEENKGETKMERNQSSEDISKIIDSYEIIDVEDAVIKGDAIGETLYSAKWILTTLISLSKVYEDGWSESIESDLCSLWDMTAEKDIVKFLLENDFYKIAHFTLKISEEPRLTEIIVGIIGNMCYQPEALNELVKVDDLVSLILNLISSDDKETLIQVLRVLQVAIWDTQKNSDSLWLKKIEECEILGKAITFILKSSTSDQLLSPAIDLIYLISDIELTNKENFLEDIFNVDELIFALCEAMIELINQKDNSHTETQLNNIESWFNIIFNIADKNLLRFSGNDNDENFKKMNIVLLRILEPYKNLSNWTSWEEKSLLCIQQCITVVVSFQTSEMPPNLELIKTILMVMINLAAAATDSESEYCQDLNQLFKYAAKYWVRTLETINEETILEMLKLCDHELINNIIKLTNCLSEVPDSVKNQFETFGVTFF